MWSSTESTKQVNVSARLSVSFALTQQLKLSVQLTTEERIFIAVVATVVEAITQAFREDADVGAITFYLARRTCPVSWRGQRAKHQPQDEKHRTSGSPVRLDTCPLVRNMEGRRRCFPLLAPE